MTKPFRNTTFLLAVWSLIWTCAAPLYVICTCAHGHSAVAEVMNEPHHCGGDHSHSHAPPQPAPSTNDSEPAAPGTCVDSPLNLAQITASRTIIPALTLAWIDAVITSTPAAAMLARSIAPMATDDRPPWHPWRGLSSTLLLI